jgi:hypothetical protein
LKIEKPSVFISDGFFVLPAFLLAIFDTGLIAELKQNFMKTAQLTGGDYKFGFNGKEIFKK